MQGCKEGVSVALELYVFSKRLRCADNELILLLMSCTAQDLKVLLQALFFSRNANYNRRIKRNAMIMLRRFCLIQSAKKQIYLEVGEKLLSIYTKCTARTAFHCTKLCASCSPV